MAQKSRVRALLRAQCGRGRASVALAGDEAAANDTGDALQGEMCPVCKEITS